MYKGIILAGGRGSRLSPLTDITNKFLMPVYDKLMIEYSVWSLVNAGVTEIAIILGTKSAGETMDYLKSGKKYGAHFTYFYQDEPLGVPHALNEARIWSGLDDVIVLCADNIIYDDLKPYLDEFHGGAFITCKQFSDPEQLKRFAILEFFPNGQVNQLVEKPQDPPSSFSFCGIQIYDNRVWNVIKGLERSGRGEYEITDVLNKYARSGLLNYELLNEPWFDCGDKDSLFEAQKYAYDYAHNYHLEKFMEVV